MTNIAKHNQKLQTLLNVFEARPKYTGTAKKTISKKEVGDILVIMFCKCNSAFIDITIRFKILLVFDNIKILLE